MSDHQLTLDILDPYWNEFKKMCIDKDISIKLFLERFIYNEVDKYLDLSSLMRKETETEPQQENQNDIQQREEI